MKSSSITSLFIFIILFTSCQKHDKYENTALFFFNDFKITTKLNATTVEFDEPIMFPHLFLKSDSLFIIQNLRTNNLLYVYNLNSRKKVKEFISFGNGPNDLLGIKGMQLIDSFLYISDTQKRTISKYNINDFHLLTDNLIPIQKVTINDYFSNLAYTDNGYVGTTQNFENKRLVFFNSKGEKEFSTGEYPYFGKEYTIIEKIEGFTSMITISKKHRRIYLFGLATDLIEMYDFQGTLLKRLHGPGQTFPQVKEVSIGNDVGISHGGDKYIAAFSSPMIVGDEIYVAYSGNHHPREKHYPPRNNILVFDMDCNPLQNHELSKPIASFTADSETKIIYATIEVPEYHIAVFEPF